MKSKIVPKLVETEPFEVAMGGYLVTVCLLLNSENNQNLAPQIRFENFLEISPKKDFSVVVSWNDVRDPTDYTLIVLDNNSAHMHKLGPIHSIPEKTKWLDDTTLQFVGRIRPSISKLQSSSEFDLAKPTVITLKKDGDNFRVCYERYA